MNTWETVVALVVVLAMCLTGCSMSPSADVIAALGKDPATASINIVYPYGTIMWCRTNPQTNAKVTCTNSGISVESQQPPQPPTIMGIPTGGSSVIVVPK